MCFSLCMCVCVYIYPHTHIIRMICNICIHTHIHIYIYTCIYVRMNVYITYHTYYMCILYILQYIIMYMILHYTYIYVMYHMYITYDIYKLSLYIYNTNIMHTTCLFVCCTDYKMRGLAHETPPFMYLKNIACIRFMPLVNRLLWATMCTWRTYYSHKYRRTRIRMHTDTMTIYFFV